MRRRIGRRNGLFALAIPAVLIGMIGLSPRAEADIALDIINTENGTKLGSIVFPTATGSSAQDVEFELNTGTRVFTQNDITAVTWALDPALSLNLEAVQGDKPCASPSDGPCSNVGLTLSDQRFQSFFRQCNTFTCQVGFTLPTLIEIVGTAPAYACVGFEPPLADGPVTARGNRALPLKAELLDQDGFALTDVDLGTSPVVQVSYHSGIGATPEDVSDQALWAGQGTSGNGFVFSDARWRFNLKVGNYTAPGTYVISMISGDGAEYLVEPPCEAQFVVNP